MHRGRNGQKLTRNCRKRQKHTTTKKQKWKKTKRNLPKLWGNGNRKLQKQKETYNKKQAETDRNKQELTKNGGEMVNCLI